MLPDLRKAIQNNIMIYDIESKVNFLTYRLISLMRTYSINYGYGELREVFAPEYALNHNDIIGDFRDKKYNISLFNIFDIKIYYSVDWTPEYINLGGYLPDGKKYVVLGVCENNSICGCF